MDPKLRIVCDEIEKGTFGDPNEYGALISALTHGGDYYLVSDDFSSYIATQELVDEAFKNKDEWATKSINSTASMGFFSADRCINEYASRFQWLFCLILTIMVGTPNPSGTLSLWLHLNDAELRVFCFLCKRYTRWGQEGISMHRLHVDYTIAKQRVTLGAGTLGH
jgi:hypothetical protein